MAKRKIALLGAAGMLGTEVAARLTQKGLAFDAFDLPDFDITDATQLQRVVENSRIININKVSSRTGWFMRQ